MSAGGTTGRSSGAARSARCCATPTTAGDGLGRGRPGLCRGGGRRGRHHGRPTWSVHGHHYALVRIDDLAPARDARTWSTRRPHRVAAARRDEFPPSVIRTIDPGAPFRLAFGSCRRSDPLDEEHLDALGADALVALAEPDGRRTAQRVAGHAAVASATRCTPTSPPSGSSSSCARRRDDRELRGGGRDPELRGVHLAVPRGVDTARRPLAPVDRPDRMLLDDHDLRDDWNTSLSWRRE